MGLAILVVLGIGLGLAFGRRSRHRAVPAARPGAVSGNAAATADPDASVGPADRSVPTDLAVLADLDIGWSHRLGHGVRRWGQLVGRAGSTAPMFREPYSEGGW